MPALSRVQMLLKDNKPWPSTLSALRRIHNIIQCLLVLITGSSRPGGRGAMVTTLIKESDTEECQREFLILISKLHWKCFFYFLLLLSRYSLIAGPRNSYTKFGFLKSIPCVTALQVQELLSPNIIH